MDSEGGVLRPMFEIFFTLFPTGYFLQILDVIADAYEAFWALLGVDLNIVGF
ncbi:MAG TPA: hypothetical protein VNT79_10550 [Phycisphaerae bacterium]|nr:hypothetical protein [Phycisphaerae bacterium]